ncbi:MAG: redoxin family protein, partial [Pseudomonadota bacterium]
MTIATGDRLPEANLIRLGAEGPEAVSLSDVAAGKTIAIFAVPGAFTGVCTTAHVPSFIRTKDDFAAKGVDTIVCVAVNDPFVMDAWGKATGASDAGLHMLG